MARSSARNLSRTLSPRLARTSAAVVATAVVGGLGTDVSSRWYRNLDKPPWQPPGAAFGPAWTTLYGLMALACARTLEGLDQPGERREFATTLNATIARRNTGGQPWKEGHP